MRFAAAMISLLCGIPLAACCSLAGPKPIPEWAMSPRIAANARSGTRDLRIVDGRPSQQREASPHDLVGNDFLPFTKEWHAREEAIDARLRKRLLICGAC